MTIYIIYKRGLHDNIRFEKIQTDPEILLSKIECEKKQLKQPDQKHRESVKIVEEGQILTSWFVSSVRDWQHKSFLHKIGRNQVLCSYIQILQLLRVNNLYKIPENTIKDFNLSFKVGGL